MTLTKALWAGIEDIYAAIIKHPFLTGLTDGTLPQDAFAFYVIQDALYLRQYAAALATLAGRAPDSEGTRLFARDAAQAVAVEQELHGSLLADLGIDPAAAAGAQAAPTNLAYTSYLLATARGGSYAEGVAAVLPCYWIYWEVGKELLRLGSPDPRYQRWIATYGGDEYGAVVSAVLDLTDGIDSGLSAAEHVRLHRHFRATSRYEWMFWDMGYRKESWPV